MPIAQEHVDHLQRMRERAHNKWNPLPNVVIDGRVNGVDYYTPVLAATVRTVTRGSDGRPVITDAPWPPDDRAAIEALRDATPADRAMAWCSNHRDRALAAAFTCATWDTADALVRQAPHRERRPLLDGVLFESATLDYLGDGQRTAWALARGANPNAQRSGCTPLMGCTLSGNAPSMEVLLEGGADPNTAEDQDRRTALHILLDGIPLDRDSERGRACLDLLLNAGADPEQRNRQGRSPRSEFAEKLDRTTDPEALRRGGVLLARLDQSVLTHQAAHVDTPRRSVRRM